MLVGMTLFELVVYLRGSFLPTMHETMGLISSKALMTSKRGGSENDSICLVLP